jgi:hypothetical protein
MKLIKIISMLAILSILFSIQAQTVLKAGTFGNGGAKVAGSNYAVNGTLGQIDYGKLSGANNIYFAGFWRGAYHLTPVEELLFDLPSVYELYQNYPNPFNPSTIIKYDLPAASNVKINVYNLLGQKVTSLQDDFKPAGRYSISFNAAHLSSGIYFYTIEAEGFKKVKRMVLAK